MSATQTLQGICTSGLNKLSGQEDFNSTNDGPKDIWMSALNQNDTEDLLKEDLEPAGPLNDIDIVVRLGHKGWTLFCF